MELKLHPYALGLLLGDGGFTGDVVTFTNAEDELFEQLDECLKPINVYVKCREYENHKQANLCSDEDRNELNRIIKELNLYGCGSREKFIPKEYLYSSVENRFLLENSQVSLFWQYLHFKLQPCVNIVIPHPSPLLISRFLILLYFMVVKMNISIFYI